VARGLNDLIRAGEAVSRINVVISLWKNGTNVGVLSSTDEKFLEKIRRWAKRNGYRVEPELTKKK